MPRLDWRSFLPPEEAETYQSAGFGEPEPFGKHPALLVIDCTVGFTGSSPDLSLEEAIKEYKTACGPVSWEALPYVTKLIDEFRAHELPIVYSRTNLAVRMLTSGATKAAGQRNLDQLARSNSFPDVISPRDGELVIEKSRASVFFGTALASYLVTRGVDSVIACGTTTSGCVRATVVDAFSHGFTTFVAEEATFDRSPTAAMANLWDMNAKYASVVSVGDVLSHIATLPR